MRAIRLQATNSPLVLAEVPEPRVGPNDVRVRIEACGICHSDAHYRSGFGSFATPRTLGHEIAGTVTEVGAGVRDVTPGDRVAIHYLLNCGRCRQRLRAGDGRLSLQEVVSRRVPFEADAINGVLDELDRGTPTLRSVVTFDSRD